MPALPRPPSTGVTNLPVVIVIIRRDTIGKRRHRLIREARHHLPVDPRRLRPPQRPPRNSAPLYTTFGLGIEPYAMT
jgi:hypothetical protein